jgi:hypothetical protein
MDDICCKSATIQALNEMRQMFPHGYRFFPHSFLLPQQFPDLQRAHNHLKGKTGQPVTWIVRLCNEYRGHGIKLIQHIAALTHKAESVVVQKYISPFLIDDCKFDFRFYMLISSLAPYTVYIYREGLARVCIQKCVPLAVGNLENKCAHLMKTPIDTENTDATDPVFTRLASSVLAQLAEIDPAHSVGLWNKICDVTKLSFLVICASIFGSTNSFNSDRRMFGRRVARTASEFDSFLKYLHIRGISIMLAENMQPIVLELNDRPSMVVTYEGERWP